MKSGCLLTYFVYSQFLKELIDTCDVFGLEIDLSRAD
jgi:hypothetical protein